MVGSRILFGTSMAFLMSAAMLEGASGDRLERVAIVEDYAGNRALITIEHEGQMLDVALGAELVDGDTVSVSGDGYAVLRFNNGSEHVDAARSPFVVTAQSGPLDDMSANFGRVLSVIAWWDDTTSDEPMRSRDGVPPAVAALERVERPVVLAGPRHLRLVWVDGKGPFDIAVFQGETEVATATTTVGVRAVDIAAEFVVGETYDLSITDLGREGSHPTTYSIYAVDTLPETSVAVPEGDELRPLLTVAELASHERGRWAFEALQQLYALPDASRFRNALINAIEHGDHP